ncbi:TetR/AcrR family transcriptional regulator [Planotetraspora sp. GP83]|uniref:TetR/AcrR family transcriptional regulator n=1 Tax=Planotetraspora sp. GP83 TaxID=3156264 RepID=UPI003518A984
MPEQANSPPVPPGTPVRDPGRGRATEPVRTAGPEAGNGPDGATAREAVGGDPAAPGRRRQERALRRRGALLDAAVALLAEGGFAAVTHRAVAQRAGIPLAATTYYFSSRDELVAQAFGLLVDRELTQMRASLNAMRDRSPERLAQVLADAYAHDRPRQLGLWELYLQAGRDPALQGIARKWTDGCEEIVASVLGRAGYACGRSEVRFVTTLLSGLWLEDVVEARPEGRERARDVVARALKAIS